MIYSLNGKLILSDKTFAVIECGGVGYKCFISLNTVARLPKVNSDVFLYTYMSVKEDAVDLYGFYSPDELECFKLLISVSGVGPKAAIALLSEFTADKIMLCIASSDSKSLTAAAGVGNKVAQRIVLELKDKVAGTTFISRDESINAAVNSGVTSNAKEAVAALVSLGFSQSDAAVAVGKYNSSLRAEDLIKQALKDLSRQV
ncbi:MAG: Holliday junction branch migration protein RuvA [Clostridiales bacterium]|nr:Holliday junction branch migration protein RuvA [Candidatus Equinaster intestinalis]